MSADRNYVSILGLNPELLCGRQSNSWKSDGYQIEAVSDKGYRLTESDVV